MCVCVFSKVMSITSILLPATWGQWFAIASC